MAKSATKKKRVTAPDFGAVLGTIGEVVQQAINDVGSDEARRAKEYVTGFLRANLAQPVGGKFSKAYVARKIREGFDPRQAIRTGKYVESIGIIRSAGASSVLFKVGFQPGMMAATEASGASEKRAEIFRRPTKGPYGRKVSKDITRRRPPYSGRTKGKGISLVRLAKILEYGASRAVATAKGTRVARQSPRPHWRPLWIWFQAQRVPILRRKIPRAVKSGIKKNLNWKK